MTISLSTGGCEGLSGMVLATESSEGRHWAISGARRQNAAITVQHFRRKPPPERQALVRTARGAFGAQPGAQIRLVELHLRGTRRKEPTLVGYVSLCVSHLEVSSWDIVLFQPPFGNYLYHRNIWKVSAASKLAITRRGRPGKRNAKLHP